MRVWPQILLCVAACSAPPSGGIWVSRDGATVDPSRLDEVTAGVTAYWSAQGFDVWPAASEADADIVAVWDPRIPSTRAAEALGDRIWINPLYRFYLGDQGEVCDGESLDLGTVLRHELGHVLGLHDIRDPVRRYQIMNPVIGWCEIRR